MGFTKLDEGILQSSIMAEDSNTFKVWIALLASCKQTGVASVSPVFLSSVCHLPLEDILRSMDKLAAPDPMSRSQDEEGRRIIRVKHGWKLINYQHYRKYLYSDSPEAIRQRRHREKGRDNRDASHMSRKGRDISASSSLILEIIKYLNKKTGKAFRPNSKETAAFIKARLAEDRTVEDFKKVIDIKVQKWANDPKMADFLRPSTLFRPANFEAYLNERPAAQQKSATDQGREWAEKHVAEHGLIDRKDK